MMTSARRGEISTHIRAAPDEVWALLADLERMGEWSPECYKVKWLDQARSPATVGARFKGRNKYGWLRWTTTCEIKVADPGRELTFSTVKRQREIVRWSYRLEPASDGTDVTESFEAMSWPLDVRFFEDVLMRDRDRRREAAMRATLDRIRAIAERSPSNNR